MLCLRVAVGVMLGSESESSKAGSGLASFSLNWTPKQVQQKHSNGHRNGAIHQQPQSHYNGNENLLTPIQEHQPRHSVGYSPLHQQGQQQQQPSRHSASGPVVVTTQWETFDSAPALIPTSSTSKSASAANHSGYPKFNWESFE
ncbi:hypothetical protein GBA52_006161 [Prunus armeniaca]|nr:hypothetical protein GBA52_006161 [Prunus armeniaca]